MSNSELNGFIRATKALTAIGEVVDQRFYLRVQPGPFILLEDLVNPTGTPWTYSEITYESWEEAGDGLEQVLQTLQQAIY